MKKYLIILVLATLAVLLVMMPLALAEAVDAVPVRDGAYDWVHLATVAGATAATLLIVQFIKLPLDRVWRIPTRAVVYVIALLIMMAAQAFTAGLRLDGVPLLAINAVVVALAAMGSYELTFAPKRQASHEAKDT